MSKDKLSYKMTLLGNTGVGKTSLFKKLVKGTFDSKSISTIGVDRKTLNFKINTSDGEKEAEITLFDTAGQEKFRSISVSYFRESKGLVMIYDITKNESFQNLGDWLNDIIENLGKKENYLIILLGNKSDIIEEDPDKRDVDEQDAKDYCTKNNILWGGEVSVKDFDVEKLNSLFKGFIEEIYKKVGSSTVKKEETTLTKSAPKKKKGFC